MTSRTLGHGNSIFYGFQNKLLTIPVGKLV